MNNNFSFHIKPSSMEASSVPEAGIIEKAEVHNLLSQLRCYLFPAQALGFCKWCFNPSI